MPDPTPFVALLLDLIHQADTLSHYHAKEAKLLADLQAALETLIDRRVRVVLEEEAADGGTTSDSAKNLGGPHVGGA